MKPKVSVIMPVYNAEKYVEQAIESILNQTFEDFELLIINDHPKDGTMNVVESIKDKRIRIIENDKNRGIAYSRNRGLEEAKGEYIALMDHDDLTDKERLELEVAFLDSHPEIGIIGGSVVKIDENNCKISQPVFALTNPGYIRAQMMFFCPMFNGSTLFRKSFVDEYGMRYQENCLGMEDYRFWIEASLHTQITNFQQTFLYWRVSETGETTRVKKMKKEERKKLYAEFQLYALQANGFKLTTQEQNIFTDAFEESKRIIYKDLEQLYILLRKLVMQAYEMKLCFADDMMFACRNRYLEMVRRNHIVCKDSLQDDGFSCFYSDMRAKVSVIILTHNQEEDFMCSINSVLAQSYINFEILIIDGGTTDYISKGVKSLKEDNPDKIYYYNNIEAKGDLAKVWNWGVKNVRGEYVAFCDGEWHPDKLAIQMKKMQDDMAVDVTFGQTVYYLNGEFSNIAYEKVDWYHSKEIFLQKIFKEHGIKIPTIVMKKEVFLHWCEFNEKISSCGEGEFFKQVVKQLNIEFINTPLMDAHITKV